MLYHSLKKKRMLYHSASSFSVLNTEPFQCRPVIKQHMQYVLDHSDEIEKTLKVQAQVSEVKNIMLNNIEKVYILSDLNSIRVEHMLLWCGILQVACMNQGCNPWFLILILPKSDS
jgi:hypothetical protein